MLSKLIPGIVLSFVGAENLPRGEPTVGVQLAGRDTEMVLEPLASKPVMWIRISLIRIRILDRPCEKMSIKKKQLKKKSLKF